jgi:hypothetical protein
MEAKEALYLLAAWVKVAPVLEVELFCRALMSSLEISNLNVPECRDSWFKMVTQDGALAKL